MALLKRAALLLVLAACPAEPKLDPKAEADGMYLSGSAAYLQGNFDQALAAYEKARALQPSDPRLPAAFAEVYLAQRKLPEALHSFQAAALSDPKRATNWSRIGYIQSVLGQREEAETSLHRALSLNPRDFDALEELGELDVKAGDVDAAVGHLLAAAQASPDAGKAALYLRAAEVLNKHARAPEALKILTDAEAAGVKAPELMVELGDERVKAGALDEAIRAYETAARATTDDPTLWELVGELQVRLGHPAEAKAAFEASIKVKPRALPHVQLARLAMARKDAAGVNAELDLALGAATGEERREVTELADLLVKVGRKADALALLANLAAEPEQAKDSALQLRTARLARELGKKDVLQATCARATDAGVRCP